MESKSRPRSVIKRDNVRVDGAAPRPPAAADVDARRALAHAGQHDESRTEAAASVRLLRLDENTQALELTCACGEVSLIEIRTEKKP